MYSLMSVFYILLNNVYSGTFTSGVISCLQLLSMAKEFILQEMQPTQLVIATHELMHKVTSIYFMLEC